MLRYQKYVLLTVIFVIVVLGLFTVYRLTQLGAFYTSQNLNPGSCKQVKSVWGPEDMALDRINGIVYISSSDRRGGTEVETIRGDGTIYRIDLESTDPELEKLSFHTLSTFNPHGIDFYMDDNGKARLFVINHLSDERHTVELFEIQSNDTLVHVDTISDSSFKSPNDLTAIGPREFYFTNDGKSRDRFIRAIDTFLKRPTGSIGYYRMDGAKIVVDNLYFPNGIVSNRESSLLFVSETISGKLLMYQRASESGELDLASEAMVGVGLDNISLDSKGNLWIGRHPNLLALGKHMDNIEYPSPSQVIRIDRSQNETGELIYSNDGNELSGSSVAITYKNYILIGAVAENKFLLCRT